jgi:hypothetical protein
VVPVDKERLVRSGARFAAKAMMLCAATMMRRSRLRSTGSDRRWYSSGCGRRPVAERYSPISPGSAGKIHAGAGGVPHRAAPAVREQLGPRDYAIAGVEGLDLHLTRRNETIRGHVFCSFLTLVLKKVLEDRIAAFSRSGSWPEIVADLDSLTGSEIEQDGNIVRSAPRPPASLAIRAAGVALPPTVRDASA